MPKAEDTIKILSSNLFPVVGVGASAGGLEAFRSLVRSIPLDSGMAYILVQHLHPDHNSSLPEILQRETHIPVLEIIDNVHVKPDHIYIIPANKILVATDGILQLSPRPKNEKNMPIDIFLTSLAEVHQNHAIGIVLSGTGMDGTIGLTNIKEHGGITMAEDPSSAAYDAMPLSAIHAEVVDFVLSPDLIPKQLQDLHNTYKNNSGNEKDEDNHSEEENYSQIISLLRLRGGVDFTYYKQTTIRRRILRRMMILNIDTLTNYINHLKKTKPELDNLFLELLIPVTSFFRDPKTFEVICKSVLPDLLKDKSTANPLRIWIAGCSTGQEAYSIGICLHEFLGEKISNVKMQVFATDLSEKSITKARLGIYSIKELEGVSENRLQLFFNKIDASYQIKKNIRDMFIFSCHNFLKDPPFGNLDMISCRNVLIYLEPFLQKKAFGTFHYALKNKGTLILGKSESVGSASELFNSTGIKDKIYQRSTLPGRFNTFSGERKVEASIQRKQEKILLNKDDFQKNADDIMLARYTPAGVIINEQLDIVQFRGSTGAYLEPSPGKASLNILKMAKEGLSFEIRNAVLKAKTTALPIIKESIPLQEGKFLVTIEVVPLLNTTDRHYMVLFKETQSAKIHSKIALRNNKSISKESLRISQLEKDLAQSREDMRCITEDQESSNEELQSANEELLSGSEELQSLNEELESSKEELQSTNEELITVNQELFDSNEQYNKARLYAEGIVTTIHEPLLVLNSNFKIKSANPAFYRDFRVTEDEILSKDVFEIQNGEWNIPSFHKQLLNIKENKSNFLEWEDVYNFTTIGERFICLNAQPILRETGEHLILLAFQDITTRKDTEEKKNLFSQELEKKVLQRTETLKATNLALQHSNKNLEQFASIASHDLQEPLRKIQTFAKLLNHRHSNDTSSDTKELLSKIVSSSERMSVLIKDVLIFSRMGYPKIPFIKTDLNKILNDVINDFELLISEKKVKIFKEILPEIDAVPLQINQLFYNLVNNAIKFSDNERQSEIRITSRMLPEIEVKKYSKLTPGRSYCEIFFKDNGIGFEQVFAEQIFLIFERLNNSMQYAGTGIGLALCQKIVIEHNGEIWAEGKENEGATFHIILPLIQKNLPAAL